ncbi:hypothetical protein GCM10010836_24510 [Aminobacter aminovorans]
MPMAFIRHDHSDPRVRAGLAHPLTDKGGGAAGGTHEYPMLPEQAVSGMECWISTDPVDFVY